MIFLIRFFCYFSIDAKRTLGLTHIPSNKCNICNSKELLENVPSHPRAVVLTFVYIIRKSNSIEFLHSKKKKANSLGKSNM